MVLGVQTPGHGLSQTPAHTAKPLTLAQGWTLDTTYTDHQHGVTFRYPSSWEATTQFAYHAPALTTSDAMPIAGFGYEEGGFPRERVVGPYSGTNLEGVGIVYSAVPAPGAAKCEATAASLSDVPGHSRVVLGHRSFSVYETGEAGMSQSIEGKLYAVYVGSTCYLFETDVAGASVGALDGIPALSSAQYRNLQMNLLNIMKSVRIMSHGDSR